MEILKVIFIVKVLLFVGCLADLENGWLEESDFVTGEEGLRMTTRTVIHCSTRYVIRVSKEFTDGVNGNKNVCESVLRTL